MCSPAKTYIFYIEYGFSLKVWLVKRGMRDRFLEFRGPRRAVLVHFINKHVCALYCMQRNTSIRGINLGIGEITPSFSLLSIRDGVMSCEVLQLASMKKLHLLRLQWRWFCFSSLPSQLRLPSLVVLDLSHSDKLTRLWENDAEIQVLYWCCILSWLGYREELQYS
jgi:hypothetical protein